MVPFIIVGEEITFQWHDIVWDFDRQKLGFFLAD